METPLHLLSLPHEILLHIAESTSSESAISSLAQTCHSLHATLNPLLYRHNANHHSSSALLWAAQKGHTSTATYSIAAGANLQTTGKDGYTPLECAISMAHEPVAELLAEHTAAEVIVHATDTRGWPLLSQAASRGMRGPGSRRSTAAYCGHAGTVSVLVARGAEVEARDDDGRTPLWLAADVVAASAVRVLLDAGADIDARDSEGRTPLYTAVVLRRGRVEATMAETVRLLVGRGAALNGVDECSATVLGTAALYGGSATLEALLQCGRGVLDVNQIQGEVGHRRTVLALAAALGEEEAVRILMQVEGIDPGIPNMENGMTALMEAVCAMSFYNEGIVRVLARHSGYAGINARDMRGRSALHHAVENQQMDAFEVMLEIDGVDVDCVDADGRTPLDYAVERELEGFVKLIQELSARRQR